MDYKTYPDEYPDEAPVWLDKWPSREAMRERFSSPVRSLVPTLLGQNMRLVLSWTRLTLRASIGSHLVTWHYDNPGWSVQCNCGFQAGACVHAAIADVLLRNVCRQEGWPLSAPAAPRPQQAESRTVHKDLGMQGMAKLDGRRAESVAGAAPAVFPPRAPAASPARGASFKTLAERRESARQLSFDFSQDVRTVKSQAASLDVAVRRQGNYAELRFFLKWDGHQLAQLLSAIRQMGYELLKGTCRYAFSEGDAAFLTWMHGYKLLKMDIRRLGSYALTLSLDEFKDWLRHWKDCPGRFRSQASGENLELSLLECPQRLGIVLEERGAYMGVNAVFVYEDGRQVDFEHLRRMLDGDPFGFLRDSMGNFRSALNFSELQRLFGDGAQNIQKSSVCSRLPVILQGHLELVQPGPMVEVETVAKAVWTVEARQESTGSYTVVLKQASQPTAAAGRGLNSSIRYGSGRYVVTLYKGDGGAELQKLIADHSTGKDWEGNYTFRNTPEGVQALWETWQALPPAVKKMKTGGQMGFLESTRSLKPSLLLHVEERGGITEMSARCVCGGETINSAELARTFKAGSSFLQSAGGSWFHVDPQALGNMAVALNEQGLDGQEQYVLPGECRSKLASLKEQVSLVIEDKSVPFVERIMAAKPTPLAPLPPHLETILRNYQKVGVAFLGERCRFGVGSILADDMGLGKTLQVLALLASWKGRSGPCLVICPASVVDVWIRQAAQFKTGLTAVAMRGNREQRLGIARGRYDLLVTHYTLARMDADVLGQCQFHCVVLDEAQAIKNPTAQITRAVRGIPSDCRLALTGTPLENSLRDLWSIMDFLNPGIFGEPDEFSRVLTSEHGRAALRRRLSLLMLRRSKALVASELPSKTEELVKLEMPGELRQAYNQELLRAREAVRGSFGQVLAAITRLRRFCCEPRLVLGEDCGLPSPKLEFLMERLGELTAGGHSVLVFSQFTTMLDIIAAQLARSGIAYQSITGDTPVPRRNAIVEQFNDGSQASVLLLSLKAAGTGLTLTRADYVFLYDPWWNPAAENQAIDRTHRIGQDKPVFAYRIALEDSVEEKVLAIIESKRLLFQEVIDGADANGNDSRLTLDELRSLL